MRVLGFFSSLCSRPLVSLRTFFAWVSETGAMASSSAVQQVEVAAPLLVVPVEMEDLHNGWDLVHAAGVEVSLGGTRVPVPAAPPAGFFAEGFHIRHIFFHVNGNRHAWVQLLEHDDGRKTVIFNGQDVGGDWGDNVDGFTWQFHYLGDLPRPQCTIVTFRYIERILLQGVQQIRVAHGVTREKPNEAPVRCRGQWCIEVLPQV
jgi:hypothetical protein